MFLTTPRNSVLVSSVLQIVIAKIPNDIAYATLSTKNVFCNKRFKNVYFNFNSSSENLLAVGPKNPLINSIPYITSKTFGAIKRPVSYL